MPSQRLSQQRDTVEAILDSAELRLRRGGYHDFSFRDLAADVGIKSASVHYHFPTKAALVGRAVARYSDRFMDRVRDAPAGRERIDRYLHVFRQTVSQSDAMCLCGLLAAEMPGLPDEVRREVRDFFQRAMDHLAEGLRGDEDERKTQAMAILARLEGAVLLARSLEDIEVFDRATSGLSADGI